MKLFDTDYTAGFWDTTGKGAVRAALSDVRENLLRLSGKTEGFAICPDAGQITVSLDPRIGAPEAYCITVGEAAVEIIGSDVLGTVYGVYALATKLLGIDPLYRFTELFPATRTEMDLTPGTYLSSPRPVRFRGWFLNDEDLLTHFRSTGEQRHIDYPFYATVISPDTLDMVLESLLRMEGNLIIPSSFVDITNPPEEALVARCVGRGLYVTQHHVEPLGVSFFRVENYIKERGIEGGVSYLTHPGIMREAWRISAGKWAKYGKNVIWQLGLRGRGDRPVWASDPSIPDDGKTRGKIISRAMKEQYDIVRAATGTDDFLSSTTLWNEASALYKEGFLKLPEGTMPIFSDVGFTQTFSRDMTTGKREPGRLRGVYYHAAFWGLGPHLCEGVDPRKMAFCLGDAARCGALDYAILNVANLREFTESARLCAAILESPEDFNLPAWERSAYGALFGTRAEEFLTLWHRHFALYADRGEEAIRFDGKRFEFSVDVREACFPQYAVTDGVLRNKGVQLLKNLRDGTPEQNRDSATALASLLAPTISPREALLADMRSFSLRLPEPLCGWFRRHFILSCLTMLDLSKWFADVVLLLDDDTPEVRRRAAGFLEDVLRERQEAESPAFASWYLGDKKSNLPLVHKMTLSR